jgi:D-alanyl-D-alanine carboxypeptidase/D-alanyl-D-alanine-endopeptidase (penicillin-binding protein 4)
MRRLLLPLALLVVAVAATVLAGRADDGGEPGDDATIGAVAGSPVLSGTRIPEWLRQPESDMLLSAAVLETTTVLPFGLPETMCVSVRRDGTVIPGHQEAVRHTPGGLQRILTAAAAVDVFLPGEPFTTEVVMDAEPAIADGVLTGDIWIIGRGDPTLSTSTYIDRFDDDRARTDVAELAAAVASQLQGMGVTRIDGSVVGDDSRYVTQYDYRSDPLPGGGTVWDADDNAANTVGPMAALLIDDGFDSWPIEVDQAANTRSSDPALEAARRFTQLLTLEGVAVSGAARNGDAPDGRTTVASVPSPSRDEIIARALIDGTTAEMLFREIGVRLGAEGQRALAFFGVASTLDSLGVEAGVPADGSGLSDADAATCDTVVELLEHPDVGTTLRDALPLVGSSTLAECAPVGAEEMRVVVSTEEDVVAVAGHFTADNGDMITFAMIANQADLAEALETPCNPLTGTLLDAIAGHPYGPDLSQLLPEPAVTG